MSDYCENRLMVFGTKKMIKKFIKKVNSKNSALTFEAHVPYEEDYEGNWNEDNWGTSRDAQDVNMDRINDTCVVYKFTTAWSPAKEWFSNMVMKEMSFENPYSFIFDYEDSSVGYYGRSVFTEGRVDRDHTFERDHKYNPLNCLCRSLSSHYKNKDKVTVAFCETDWMNTIDYFRALPR